MSRGGWAIAIVVAAVAPAVAEQRPQRPPIPAPPPSTPDGAAQAQAEEANVEAPHDRAGFRIGAAIGPAMQLGFGVDESSGTGPGVSVRIGTAASPRFAWLLELAYTAYLAKNDAFQTTTNTSGLAVLGGQYHLRDSFWLRAGAGLAVFSRRTESGPRNRDFVGVGTVVGGGFDLLRRGGFALSIEVCGTSAIYPDGVILGGFGGLGAMFY